MLPELDARLIESIDFVKLTRVGRCNLEKHHELANMRRIDAIEMNGHVGSPAPGERASSRALLDVDQLAERVTGKIPELFYVGESGGDGDIDSAVLHGDESDGLVGWAFHEELHLRVLIRRSQRRQWRRTHRSSV